MGPGHSRQRGAAGDDAFQVRIWDDHDRTIAHFVHCRRGYAEITKVCYERVPCRFAYRTRSPRFGSSNPFSYWEINAGGTTPGREDRMMLTLLTPRLALTIRLVINHCLQYIVVDILGLWMQWQGQSFRSYYIGIWKYPQLGSRSLLSWSCACISCFFVLDLYQKVNDAWWGLVCLVLMQRGGTKFLRSVRMFVYMWSFERSSRSFGMFDWSFSFYFLYEILICEPRFSSTHAGVKQVFIPYRLGSVKKAYLTLAFRSSTDLALGMR